MAAPLSRVSSSALLYDDDEQLLALDPQLQSLNRLYADLDHSSTRFDAHLEPMFAMEESGGGNRGGGGGGAAWGAGGGGAGGGGADRKSVV